jgi:hypothetical protein
MDYVNESIKSGEKGVRMENKAVISGMERENSPSLKPTLRTAAEVGLHFAAAFILSRLQLFGVYLPFGLALSCAVPLNVSGISAFAGVLLGLVSIQRGHQ